ncbi:MAG: Gfo/Idh/MocA family protein [Pirellulaceae bacterium]
MFRTDRRSFLGATAVAAGAMIWGRPSAGAQGASAKRLQLGVIGVGWYGMVDAKAALQVGDVDIVAICDVDSAHLEAGAAELEQLQGRRPRTFKHYEELLGLVPLDAVIIATPPHWHALQLLAAIARGKDIYCEKPLAYDIREGQAMLQAVEKSDRIVQIGFQRRQSRAFQEAAEYVQSGALGELVQVDAQIHYRAGLEDPTPQDPPATLDWNLWCGPGPLIAYSPQVSHKSWRLEQASGHGHLVDWGIHLIDAVRTRLSLGMPKQVTAAGGLYRYAGCITTPDTLSVHFDFENLPVHWRHRLWGATELDEERTNGVFCYCTEGTVFASDQSWTVVRPGKDPEQHKAEADLGVLHMANFLACVRSRQQPICTIRSGFESTATVQLAMISYETGTTVRWDAQNLAITDNPAAQTLLQRPYRQPWQHPFKPA